MESDLSSTQIQNTRKKLEFYFPDQVYNDSMIEESLEDGEIFFRSTEILPYLQTALLDNKILEVELDAMDRLYFGRIYDDLPEMVQKEVDGEQVWVEPQYTAGDYLKDMTHLISLPLEPGIGNLQIRYTKKIVIRIFTSSLAIELGTSYEDMCLIRDLPVLRLAYPVIGRLVRGAREFRAKPAEDMDLQVMVMGKRKHGTIKTGIVEISARGMSFSIKRKEQDYFRLEETRTLEFVHHGMMTTRIKGVVRHVSKVRGREGTEYICGVEFDLVTRALAAEIESLVATVQRTHLKELAKKSQASGLNLIL